ncbi:MAG: 16S rRNA (adenine(1518)-N(6)/adenine(1519)-N(6))-dimethyltransferase RsmA [Chitinophagaceae bacterium]
MQYVLKKSLGQHFLKDENICKKIVAEVKQTINETNVKCLLEVGSGAGALTKYLMKIPDIDFKIIEIDKEKVEFLQTAYPSIKEKIIHEDFLEMHIPFEDDFIVVGNFPYNISTQILFKILEWREQVPAIIGMFQKEVAQRIASNSGNKIYGILSVLIQAFYEVEYLFDVSQSCFNPPPKVMSGVIKLKIKNEKLEMKSERSFFVLVKTAFNQRRKMLRNATKSLFDESTLQNEIFNKRAEQLTIKDFANLTFEMK